MKTRVQKWGHSLALRIPKSFAVELGLEHDSPVNVRLFEDQLIVTPVREPRFTLEQLLKDINAENLHAETFTIASMEYGTE